jgi:hypothetical protein
MQWIRATQHGQMQRVARRRLMGKRKRMQTSLKWSSGCVMYLQLQFKLVGLGVPSFVTVLVSGWNCARLQL